MTVLKRRCQSSELLGHHLLLAMLEGPSSCRAQVVSLLLGWQHTWDLLAMAASVNMCGWPWLISQPASRGAQEAAVVSALNAGSALCSNVGSQLKNSLLGMPVPRGSRVPWAGWRCALSCPMSWSVYHWMASLAELAISSLIKRLCFSSPGERGNGHLLAGRKDFCCSPQRCLWHCCPHLRTRVKLL